MMAAPRIAIATGAGVATPRPVQPAATAGDAMGPAGNDGFATRLDAVGTGVADGPVTPAADAGAAAGAAAGEVAPDGAPAAEAAAALAVAIPAMPVPQDAAVAIPDLQSLTAEPGAAQAPPTAPLPTASLDHKDAATQALRAQLFPDEAGQRAAAHGMPATIAAQRAPLQAQSASLPILPPSAVAAGAAGDAAAPVLQAAASTSSPPVVAAVFSSGRAFAPADTAANAAVDAAPGAPVRMAVADVANTVAWATPAAANAAAPSGVVATTAAAAPPEAGRTAGDTLLGVLGARIQAQLQQGVQQAVIRLEPYMAGTVQLELRHEAGVLRVHLSASHDEVVRQLQGIGEGLRQDLAGRQFTEVSVQVAQQRHGDAQGQGRQARDDAPLPAQPGRALGESDEAYSRFAAALRRVDTSGA